MKYPDQTKAQIALEWLNPDVAIKKRDPDGTQINWPLSNAELLDILDGIHPPEKPRSANHNASRTIYPILLDAIASNLIEVKSNIDNRLNYSWAGGNREQDPACGYDAELGRLSSKFQSLYEPLGFKGKAIAVRPEHTQSNPDSKADIHDYLGDACAHEIHGSKLLHSNQMNAPEFFSDPAEKEDNTKRMPASRFAFGSGRGPYYTERHLSRIFGKRGLELNGEVSLLSLTGSLFTGSLDSREISYDADIIITNAAQWFRTDHINIKRINFPIASEPVENKALLDRTWLCEEQFKDLEPNIIVTGVGALKSESKHRLVEELKNNEAGEPHIPATIIEKLRELQYEVDKCEKECGFICAGDICNRIFLVYPPPGAQNILYFEKKRRLILNMINDINKCFLTVKKRQLRQLSHGHICIVAGGIEKAPALHTILTRKYYLDKEKEFFQIPISRLVTSEETLVKLIEYAETRPT